MYVSSCRVCFCTQKTAYEMRISDWSSDVCSSDLPARERRRRACSSVDLLVRAGAAVGGAAGVGGRQVAEEGLEAGADLVVVEPAEPVGVDDGDDREDASAQVGAAGGGVGVGCHEQHRHRVE